MTRESASFVVLTFDKGGWILMFDSLRVPYFCIQYSMYLKEAKTTEQRFRFLFSVFNCLFSMFNILFLTLDLQRLAPVGIPYTAYNKTAKTFFMILQ